MDNGTESSRMNRTKLEELYRHIFEEGKSTLAKGGAVDSFLANPQTDTRMGVSLVIRVPDELQNPLWEELGELREMEPALYYYPQLDYHVTLLDLLRGRPGLTCPPELAGKYLDCVKAAAADIGPFSISLEGLTASREAVMAKGYYEEGMQKLRAAIRNAVRGAGLPLEERYETFSCHVSAVRFPSRISNPEKFFDFLKEESEVPFGTFCVGEIEMVYHDWYDSKKRILGRIRL